MARDPDDEDDALRWEGDDDSTLAPGWKRVGTPVPLTYGVGATTGEGEVTDAAASESPTDDVDQGAPAQPGSAELILLGVFGGVYLLYTLGWILSVVRVQNPAEDPVGAFMFSLGLWLAVLAPGLWFGVAFALTRARPRARLVWLLVGAIVLLPIAFVAGVTT
ncbi:MAG TPA: DNA polymerase III subunit gamma/tau [Agromyces sp.]|nr:DNA polymerase III subunit gamma/tau [Agromyces sp.]